MNTSITLQQLQTLKLKGMAQYYETLLNLPVHQHPEPHLLIGAMIEAETLHRNHSKTQLNLSQSKLRYQAHIEEIDYSKDRNITKDLVIKLSDCSYIKRAENILISGSTGVGKSFIACALGYQACANGYKVQYHNLNRFIEKVAQAKLEGSMVKLLNQIEKTHLLILDDFGISPLDSNTRLALLQLLEDRYGKKSIIIASQLPIQNWYEYINQSTIADAIMDRLTSNAHRLELKGESLRSKTIKN
jgi:DNA replication protein DnaC